MAIVICDGQVKLLTEKVVEQCGRVTILSYKFAFFYFINAKIHRDMSSFHKVWSRHNPHVKCLTAYKVIQALNLDSNLTK